MVGTPVCNITLPKPPEVDLIPGKGPKLGK